MSRVRLERMTASRWRVEPLGKLIDLENVLMPTANLPAKYADAVALLYTCDNDTELPGIGYRVSQNVFYVEDG